MPGMEPDRYRHHLARLMALVGIAGYVSAVLTVCNVWGVLL